MRRALALALLLAVPILSPAQEIQNRAATLAVKYDLDTPASVEIVASVDLTNTTLTIANQPDPPALIAYTIVDTTPSITAGTITHTGVDAHGTTRTEVLDASAGAGTYTTTFRYASVTSAVTGSFATLGGSSDETIEANTTESAVYCKLDGRTDPFGPPLPGDDLIETSGSSTTVVESNTGSNPFALLSVGDILVVTPPTARVPVILAVDAKASDASITVDTAVDLGTSGVSWSYRSLRCGFGVGDGWVPTARFGETLVCVEPLQGTSTGALNWWIEVKNGADGAGPVQAYPDNSSTHPAVVAPAGVGYEYGQCINLTTPHDWLRVGLSFAAGGDEGTDTALLKERITVSLTGRQ